MKLLGVDPGFASLGWCVVDVLPHGFRFLAAGLVSTSKSNRKVLSTEDNLRRACEIAAELRKVVTLHKPGILLAEAMSFPRSSSVAAKMAMAWGVMAALKQELDIPFFSASPQMIKVAVCGVKTASKEDIKQALLLKYPALEQALAKYPKSKHEHLCDALGAIEAGRDHDLLRMARGMLHG